MLRGIRADESLNRYKILLRNDYWCKGLGFSQPKSEAYGRYLELKGKLRTKAKPKKWGTK